MTSIPQTAPTICLGSVFRAHPRLILDDRAKVWAEGVFVSNDEENKARLFGVIHEFLISQSEKKMGASKYDLRLKPA